ncbi:helix-turn-helix transcriptional regulator [Conchiformibius steedae]|nr:helix-turn-helix transcriptional regulator [Conchiformibius steedae]
MAQLAVSELDKVIGKRIQSKRKEQGFSADKLSEKIGISQQQLSRYERGDNKINLAHLIAIAQMLNTPLLWFLQDAYTDSHHTDTDLLYPRLLAHWQNATQEQKESLIRFLDMWAKS